MSKYLYETASSHLMQAQILLKKSARHFAQLSVAGSKISPQLMDQHQTVLYELAQMATRFVAAEQLLNHAETLTDNEPENELVNLLAHLNLAKALQALSQMLRYREAIFGLSNEQIEALFAKETLVAYQHQWLDPQKYRDAAALIEQTNSVGADALTDEQTAVQATFRRYATDKVAPWAEKIHREDLLIPEDIIQGLAGLGCFGLSIPEQYGGFEDDAQPDHIVMVIVSDELSRASFGSAGSLGTRPEILAKALLKGGTEAQKRRWLPAIAAGEKQVAVSITEPDHGSDVANIRLMAQPVEGGWRLNGTKLWSTYAGRADLLMVLARTDPDLSKGHRGLSLFVIEKPPAMGHTFEHLCPDGRLSGRAISTIGYRGMHSFELLFENFFVPADQLIGKDTGLGRGFYLQMHGFAGSRLQTAGRALGLTTAAFEAGLTYARQRHIFGQALITYPLAQAKLAEMAIAIQAGRRLTYYAARQVDQGSGGTEAAMAKLYTAQAAEWVTREAQQLHGGMGYAEEFAISRHFVDARVLAIFEGAEEVLALRIIARTLLEEALQTT
ncbi:MAG: acyl-CoA dehydrogenase family protein [Chloroflexota bacterium]